MSNDKELALAALRDLAQNAKNEMVRLEAAEKLYHAAATAESTEYGISARSAARRFKGIL